MVTYCSLHRSCALVCFLVLYLLQQEGGGGCLGQLHHKNAKCPITPRPGMLLRCTFVVWPLAIVLCDLPCPLDLCLLPCKIKNYSLMEAFFLLFICYSKLFIAYYSSQQKSTRSSWTCLFKFTAFTLCFCRSAVNLLSYIR